VARLKHTWFVAAARGLAGVLAAALLLFELLSTNGRFHHAFHATGKTSSNGCIVCLFAKGQVDSPQATPAITLPLLCCFILLVPTESAILVDFRYLASPSRAPPSPGFFPPVIG